MAREKATKKKTQMTKEVQKESQKQFHDDSEASEVETLFGLLNCIVLQNKCILKKLNLESEFEKEVATFNAMFESQNQVKQ